jgi:NAD(P)H-hydrate epimerase
MKIFEVEQIRQLDALTIEKEPVASIDLMERAARECFKWLEHHIPTEKSFFVFCGPGNNGGDGLAIARMLAQKKRKTSVFIVNSGMKCSEDFTVNHKRLLQNPKIAVQEIAAVADFPEIPADAVLIDALFGSGLSRPVDGMFAELITYLNRAGCYRKIAIDIPSGLFAEDNSDNDGSVFRADFTLSFQFPKLSFFFPENGAYTGEWKILPIGLHPASIAEMPAKIFFTEAGEIRSMIKPRLRFSHKGTYGHALLIAGSRGKTGAAVLGARAALRSGCGLLTVHVPSDSLVIMQTAVPEAMTSIDDDEFYFSSCPSPAPYDAIAAGPGLGTHEQSAKALKRLIQESANPLILDADALNILSENKTWIPFLIPGSILTPHPGEFERLCGKSRNGFERIKMQIEFSIKHRVYVILKGAYSSISSPDGQLWFNPTGNPGMATAGSGDVLTGILLGLKAQGYSSLETCLLGTYLHGLSGDIAAEKRSQQGMIAGDISEYLAKVWRLLSKQ